MKKTIIFFACLIVCSVMVFADGGGAFTTDPAADANWATYTGGDSPHDFSNTADTNFDDCDASPIPDWYMTDAGICDWSFSDEDDDGCTNNEEYKNLIAEKNNNPKPYANCLVEGDGICVDPFSSPGWCADYRRHLGEQNIDAIPEFNGTAIILIAILTLVIFGFMSHFQKK